MMNRLSYFKDGIVSSIEDIESLAKQKSGKILVISDSHNGDKDLLLDIIEKFAEDVDVLLYCGDGVSDIGELVQEALGNEKLQEKLPPVIAFVRGNNDANSYVLSADNENEETSSLTEEKLANFKMIQVNVPESLIFSLAGRKIYCTHGHRHYVSYGLDTLYSIAENIPADIVFFGHTHRAYFEETFGTLFLNPGSLCYPRGGQEPMFAVVSFPGVTERYHVEYFTMDKSLLGSYSFTAV